MYITLYHFYEHLKFRICIHIKVVFTNKSSLKIKKMVLTVEVRVLMEQEIKRGPVDWLVFEVVVHLIPGFQ